MEYRQAIKLTDCVNNNKWEISARNNKRVSEYDFEYPVRL